MSATGPRDGGALMTNTYYHGTRVDLKPGDVIEPAGDQASAPAHVYLTTNLDAAIWAAELAAGEDPGRVYTVEPVGQVEQVTDLPPGPPTMSWRSRDPLRVTGEVTEWRHYHGTRADLKPGDLIKPGHSSNYGTTGRTMSHVYFARTMDAAIWGAELALGDGPGRVYRVEPTGPVEDDPNLTDAKFRGNPTKSFRSREPLRVIEEVADWQGHSPDAIRAMKDGLAQLERLGIEAVD